MEQKPCIPLLGSPVRSSRDVPPAHYTLKIESFSQLQKILGATGRKNYETDIFEASGYKWKLSLYPNGDKDQNGEGHISLYLAIAETESLPVGWEVKVILKLFLLDQVHDTYSIYEDISGKIRHYNEYKKELGFAKLLPLNVFKDSSNGFLVRDKCVFGVEVFVLDYSGKGECITLQEKNYDIYTWRIDNFSLQEASHTSDSFTLSNRTWEITTYPTRVSGLKGEFLTLALELTDIEEKGKAYVNYRLRLRNQLHNKHEEITDREWFAKSSKSWEWKKFLTLSDLNNASLGFLVKNTLIVEFEVISISCVKNFSQAN